MAESFLYSFNAKRVTSKLKANGNYRLNFKIEHASNVSSFSEKPARDSSFYTISHFEKEFDSLFPGSKPNASLNFWSEGKSQIIVHTIKSLKINGNGSKVVINAKPIQVLGSSKTLPEDISEASFFVDNGDHSGNCNGQDNCNTCTGFFCFSA